MAPPFRILTPEETERAEKLYMNRISIFEISKRLKADIRKIMELRNQNNWKEKRQNKLKLVYRQVTIAPWLSSNSKIRRISVEEYLRK